MSDHQKFIDVATRLIAKHGRDVNFLTVSAQPVDATKPWKGTATADTTVGPVKAAFVPFRGFEFGSIFTDSELFKGVEQICLVSAATPNLETAHKISDSGKEYKIEWIQRLRPGDQTILYAFGVD